MNGSVDAITNTWYAGLTRDLKMTFGYHKVSLKTARCSTGGLRVEAAHNPFASFFILAYHRAITFSIHGLRIIECHTVPYKYKSIGLSEG